MDKAGNNAPIIRTLEAAVRDLEAFHDRVRSAPADNDVSELCQTVTVTVYPTTASAVYGCVVLTIDCDDTEGAAATYTTDGSDVIYALNLGGVIPAVGTRIVVHSNGGRWVFRYDG